MAKTRRTVKTARQIAASRRNIRIAQKVSARNRRGTGKSLTRRTAPRALVARKAVPAKPGRVKAHIARNKGKYGTAVGLVAVAGATYGGYKAYDHRNPVVYHRTSVANAASITKSRQWVSNTHNTGVEGTPTGIWFTTVKPGKLGTEQYNVTKYGPMVLRTRVPRKHIVQYDGVLRNHLMSKGYDKHQTARFIKQHGKQLKATGYIMVDSRHVNGRRVRAKYQYYGNRKMYGSMRDRAIYEGHIQPSMAYLMDNWKGVPKRRSGVRGKTGRIIYRAQYSRSARRVNSRRAIQNSTRMRRSSNLGPMPSWLVSM